MAGEWSPTLEVTLEIQEICDQVKGQVQKKTTLDYLEFKAVVYRKQTTTAGDNFLIKVQVGAEDYIHLSLLHKRAGVITLHAVQQNKTRASPLEPFIN
ncbi:stefin-C-like [Lycodopsis pacificus]